MSAIETLALSAALLAGAASMALAQQSQMPDNPAHNAAASGGGTHQSSQVTGSGANSQKAVKNQNGYRPQ